MRQKPIKWLDSNPLITYYQYVVAQININLLVEDWIIL